MALTTMWTVTMLHYYATYWYSAKVLIINTHNKFMLYYITLGALRGRVTVLGLCVCVCVCVCVSVTTLVAVSLISTLKLNYEQLYHGILNSWILLRSEVMVSFDTPQAPAVYTPTQWSARSTYMHVIYACAICISVQHVPRNACRAARACHAPCIHDH